MRASFLAIIGVLLMIVIVPLKPAAAEYPFDSLPALPPLAGVGSSDDAAVPYSSDSAASADPLAEEFADFDGDYGLADDDPFLDRLPYVDRLFSGPPPLWAGYFASRYTAETERSLWDGDLLLPILQDGRTLWFWNVRGQVDNENGGRFDIGTGVRTLARPGLVFGTYLYYDRLFSEHDNEFNQGTFGVEVMEVNWDFRFNVYFPESKAKAASAMPFESVSDGMRIVRRRFERAYWGFDIESGLLLGAWGPNAQHELRGFLGVFHFDHTAAGFDNITGPRVRFEWRYYDIPMFGNGSRLTCGFSLQADDERGGDASAFIGLRIPLDPWAKARPPLSRLQRRILDPVVREVGIITRTRRIVTGP